MLSSTGVVLSTPVLLGKQWTFRCDQQEIQVGTEVYTAGEGRWRQTNTQSVAVDHPADDEPVQCQLVGSGYQCERCQRDRELFDAVFGMKIFSIPIPKAAAALMTLRINASCSSTLAGLHCTHPADRS